MNAFLKRILPSTILANLRQFRDIMKQSLLLPYYARGYEFARNWKERSVVEYLETGSMKSQALPNPLWTYFTNHTEGHGIWKWEHYFDIYHRHFSKFVGTPVKVLEIGIYSGGSLDMWRSYFGDECQVYGVDIEEACKIYEREKVAVFIGDQEDPDFWARFNKQVQGIDILIDDGGHTAKQQMVTLEQMLPYLRPGGVYLCEDLGGLYHEFTTYVSGLIAELNKTLTGSGPGFQATPFQSACHSIHFYPYVVVIEKHLNPPSNLVDQKRGTQWQPFSLPGADV